MRTMTVLGWRAAGSRLAILSIAFVAGAAGAWADDGYSAAARAVFSTPHLQNIAAPQTIRYDFRQSGSAVEDFADTVEMIVTEINVEGGKNVRFNFLTGARNHGFPPVENFRGNPLIMMFLQYDVEGMRDITGGSDVYFRNRIRDAFVDRAIAEDVRFDAGGCEVAGTRVVVQPFVGVSRIDQFPDYEHKTYEFLLSPEVPGGVYQIRAVTAGTSGNGPLQEETLVYNSVADR